MVEDSGSLTRPEEGANVRFLRALYLSKCKSYNFESKTYRCTLF